jgi:hypothetical protein
VVGRVEQRVDLGDGHPLGGLAGQGDLVAGADLTFLEHPEVEPGAVAAGEEGRHPRLAGADADAVAGDPGLGHLEQGAANAVAVADADDVVGQAVDGEVLAEVSGDQVGPGQLAGPVVVGLELVDEDGALLAAVAGQVALPVAGQVEAADPAAAGKRVLPDTGVHGAAVPRDVARQTDVDRQQSLHALTFNAALGATGRFPSLGCRGAAAALLRLGRHAAVPDVAVDLPLPAFLLIEDQVLAVIEVLAVARGHDPLAGLERAGAGGGDVGGGELHLLA